MFSFWKKKKTKPAKEATLEAEPDGWSLEEKAPKSWAGRPGIYNYIESRLAKDTPNLSVDTLPDEDLISKDGLHWVAGGSDGAFGHHMQSGGSEARVNAIYAALKALLENSSTENIEAFSAELLKGSVMDFVDPLVSEMIERQELPPDRLLSLSEWLVRNSPDREPIKFGIAMMGIFQTEHFKSIFMTLGKHEEFTLYCAVAVSNSLENPEPALFELAQGVHGWGRVQAVERLAKTTNAEIKAWMIRKGFRNSVMDEYLACLCATTGELLKELQAESVDEPLLLGAGDLIAALLRGGPAEGIDHYPDGAAAVERYLHHLTEKNPSQLGQLLIVDSIRDFLKTNDDWTEREARGWTSELRSKLLSQCERLIALPFWNAMIGQALDSKDRVAFFIGEAAARVLGIDTWEKCFQQVQNGGTDSLYSLMQTKDEARFDRALALAETVIPLEQIATGPARELGLGPKWLSHNTLDYVVQHLGQFPGKGWPFLAAGLRSPVTRNRNLALRTLSEWKKDAWPAEARPLLVANLGTEPDEEVKTRIQQVLNGAPIS